MSRRVSALLLAACLLGAACSNASTSTTTAPVATAPAASSTTTILATSAPAPGPTDAATTSPPTTVQVTTSTATGTAWETVAAPADCMCAGGDPFSWFVRRGDPAKVMFFLEGGGACFSRETCDPNQAESPYSRHVDSSVTRAGGADGIFAENNPKNPFAGWTVVFVPYCTGDVHIGNATTDYGGGVVIHHNGYVNGTTALGWTHDQFPEAAQVAFVGESAGSIPTPLYAGLAADMWPTSRIFVLADGSGAYPDITAVNQVIGTEWGTASAIPPWPENAGQTTATWSLPGLFVQAHKHAPRIEFARHDYAFDKVQQAFGALAGIPGDRLVELIDKNEQQIEASGADLPSYVSPGNDHTVLHTPRLYTETVDGTALIDWVTALVDGKPISDVHCVDCGA